MADLEPSRVNVDVDVRNVQEARRVDLRNDRVIRHMQVSRCEQCCIAQRKRARLERCVFDLARILLQRPRAVRRRLGLLVKLRLRFFPHVLAIWSVEQARFLARRLLLRLLLLSFAIHAHAQLRRVGIVLFSCCCGCSELLVCFLIDRAIV